MTSNARFTLGALQVDVGSHQWDFEDAKTYVERSFGTGPYGVLFRSKVADSFRTRRARFVKSDRLIDSLRDLVIQAGRRGSTVIFTPDVASPGVTWTVHFPLDWEATREVDNREEVTLLMEETV